MATQRETATLGGGCFWCVEAVFEPLQGIESVTSGYAGGHVENPTYPQVCEKNTGHAEVVRLTFDPAVIPYREILEIFFATHNPTTLNQQGNDIGPQYRSVIFTHSDEQQSTAEALIGELTAEQVFPQPIVTEVLPAPTFYPAEYYHQGYFRDHPAETYCAFVIAPKVQKMRRKYAAKLKG